MSSKAPTSPSDSKDETYTGVDKLTPEASSTLSSSATRKSLRPVQTGLSTSTTGISDDAAKEAHDFMRSSTRRLSETQSPHSPGLTDQLMQDTHVFWNATATRRESHSKHLPDVTLPGMTDEILEEALEFVDGVEGRKG
jgi:hypothetical protein